MLMLWSVLVVPAFAARRLKAPVVELTDSNWKRKVDRRDNNSVLLVMFHGEHCPACRQAYPAFQEAATEAGGAFVLGELDTSKHGNTAYEYQIRAIPTFYVFYPGGKQQVQVYPTARNYFSAGMNKLPDRSLAVNESWVDVPSAVLFTERKKSPLWNAVSCRYFKRPFRVGSTHDKQVWRAFNVRKNPTIMFRDGLRSEVYEGPAKFRELSAAIDSFFFGSSASTGDDATPKASAKPRTKGPEILQLTNISDCRGPRICVINIALPGKEFAVVAKEFASAPLRFRSCSDSCPFSFASSAPAWIMHNRRERAIGVATTGELRAKLERVVDGTAPWVDFATLEKGFTEL